MKLQQILAGSFLLVGEVFGHSWLHCSNYHATISGQDFDESECNGYIRYWSTEWGATPFANDRGINYFGSDGAWCQSTFSEPIADMYDDSYPYANYYVGDTVRLVWPAKNHANYECFANIPDTSMKLYYNPTPNQTADISSLSDWEVLWDFQTDCEKGTNGCGFQNCPEFCDDTDGAPCFGDVEITSDAFDKDGFYTFMWYWIFNPGSPYTTCFEAFVHTDGGGGGSGALTPSPTSESEDGGSGSNNSPIDYIVQVPICYDGAAYDSNTLVDGANNAFDSSDDISFSVIDYLEIDADTFNSTIQTHTYDATLITGYALNTDQTLCSSIETGFGTGSCYVCDEGAIKVFGQGSSNSDSSTSGDGEAALTILWAVVITIIILAVVFGVCYYLQKAGYISCTESSIVWHGANGATGKGAPPPMTFSDGTTNSTVPAPHLKAVPSHSTNRPKMPPPVPTA